MNDRYLHKLGQLETLEQLDLRATAATDRIRSGACRASNLPNMKRIYLANTATTENGISKLRSRLGHLPTLSISW